MKQAARAWYGKLKGALIWWGFKNAISDTSLFSQKKGNNHLLLIVYVDDIIITGSKVSDIQRVVRMLRNEFALKELGSPSYFLGIEMKRDEHDSCKNKTEISPQLH